MKKISAILFLAVGLFNLGGYRLLTNYREACNTARLQARFDRADYNEAELVSVKTPLNMPYYTSSSEQFERADGEITVEGIAYKYVKRRVYKDTLELLCLKDATGTEIKKVKADYYTLTNDLTDRSDKKAGNIFKCFCFEYCQAVPHYDCGAALTGSNRHFPVLHSFFLPQYFSRIDKPPA